MTRSRRRGARRADPRIAVAVAGGRLQDLPAAVPVPHDRPPARGAVAGRDARHGRARGPASSCSTCRPRERTPRGRAGARSTRSGQQLLDEHPSSRSCASDACSPTMTPTGSELREWLESADGLVDNYFALEDPTRLEPAGPRAARRDRRSTACGCAATSIASTSSPAGDIRVVDYKTGSLPREAFEAKALFQMKFYALVLWRTRGVVPRQLQLIYLADRDTLSYSPTRTSSTASSAPCGRSGRRSRRPPSPTTSGRARAGSAIGATTTRCARPSAALPRRSRSRRRRAAPISRRRRRRQTSCRR